MSQGQGFTGASNSSLSKYWSSKKRVSSSQKEQYAPKRAKFTADVQQQLQQQLFHNYRIVRAQKLHSPKEDFNDTVGVHSGVSNSFGTDANTHKKQHQQEQRQHIVVHSPQGGVVIQPGAHQSQRKCLSLGHDGSREYQHLELQQQQEFQTTVAQRQVVEQQNIYNEQHIVTPNIEQSREVHVGCQRARFDKLLPSLKDFIGRDSKKAGKPIVEDIYSLLPGCLKDDENRSTKNGSPAIELRKERKEQEIALSYNDSHMANAVEEVFVEELVGGDADGERRSLMEGEHEDQQQQSTNDDDIAHHPFPSSSLEKDSVVVHASSPILSPLPRDFSKENEFCKSQDRLLSKSEAMLRQQFRKIMRTGKMRRKEGGGGGVAKHNQIRKAALRALIMIDKHIIVNKEEASKEGNTFYRGSQCTRGHQRHPTIGAYSVRAAPKGTCLACALLWNAKKDKSNTEAQIFAQSKKQIFYKKSNNNNNNEEVEDDGYSSGHIYWFDNLQCCGAAYEEGEQCVMCDKCKKWFHLECLDLTMDKLGSEYECNACESLRIRIQQKKEKKKREEEEKEAAKQRKLLQKKKGKKKKKKKKTTKKKKEEGEEEEEERNDGDGDEDEEEEEKKKKKTEIMKKERKRDTSSSSSSTSPSDVETPVEGMRFVGWGVCRYSGWDKKSPRFLGILSHETAKMRFLEDPDGVYLGLEKLYRGGGGKQYNAYVYYNDADDLELKWGTGVYRKKKSYLTFKRCEEGSISCPYCPDVFENTKAVFSHLMMCPCSPPNLFSSSSTKKQNKKKNINACRSQKRSKAEFILAYGKRLRGADQSSLVRLHQLVVQNLDAILEGDASLSSKFHSVVAAFAPMFPSSCGNCALGDSTSAAAGGKHKKKKHNNNKIKKKQKQQQQLEKEKKMRGMKGVNNCGEEEEEEEEEEEKEEENASRSSSGIEEAKHKKRPSSPASSSSSSSSSSSKRTATCLHHRGSASGDFKWCVAKLQGFYQQLYKTLGGDDGGQRTIERLVRNLYKQMVVLCTSGTYSTKLFQRMMPEPYHYRCDEERRRRGGGGRRESKTTGAGTKTAVLASNHCSLTRGMCSVCGKCTSDVMKEEEEGEGEHGSNARMETSDEDNDDDRKGHSPRAGSGGVGSVCEHHRRTLPTYARKGPQGGWKALRSLRRDAVVRALQYTDNIVAKLKTEKFSFHSGDIIFLYRNAICLTKGIVRKEAEKAVLGMIDRWDKVVSITSDSQIEYVMGYVECLHAKQELHKMLPIETKSFITKLIRKATKQHALEDIIRFNPHPFLEADKVPTTPKQYCYTCGMYMEVWNECQNCGAELHETPDFEGMCEAVVWTSVFEDIGVPLEACDGMAVLVDVLPLIKHLRPYKGISLLGRDLYRLQCYFITHLAYILGGWGRINCKAQREMLNEEIVFLLLNMDTVIRMKDPELVGEFVQALHIFGFHDSHPIMERGHRFLLHSENKTCWAGARSTFYKRYHSAYCGIIGLSDFQFQKGRKMPQKWIDAFTSHAPSSNDEDSNEDE